MDLEKQALLGDPSSRDINVRFACPEDAPAIHEFDCYRVKHAPQCLVNEVRSTQELKNLLSAQPNPNGKLYAWLVAETAGSSKHLIGSGTIASHVYESLANMTPALAQTAILTITTRRSSSSMEGAETALVRRCVDWAKQCGTYRWIVVRCLYRSDQSGTANYINALKVQGFRETERLPGFEERNNVLWERIALKLDLKNIGADV